MPTLLTRVLALLAVPVFLAAQGGPRLYNQRLDKQADELKRLAESTANGQFFEAELQNLEQLTKPTLDRIFTSARRLATDRINGTTTWGDLQDTLGRIEKLNEGPPDRQEQWKSRTAELKQKIEAARAAAAGAAPSGTEPGIAIQILAHAADASDLFDAADQLQTKDILKVTRTDLRIAETLTDLAGQFTPLLQAFAKNAATAAEASDAVRTMEIAMARAELDHIAALGRIEARRLAAMDEVTAMHGTAVKGLKCLFDNACDGLDLFKAGEVAPTHSMEATLKQMRAAPASEDSRNRLETTLYLLENYAALCARANTPNRLAEARAAIEGRRHAIRRDAIVAQSFESVLASGAQRLAAYYKGGIRPEVLAQLAQALATAGLIPAVIGK
ncbi:MAG: hypothetical protein SGI92_25830 [Bryobacteraceae bacterium]|nr:hypothetical protein [Bryobacteraceae bacterium]